VTQDVLDLYRRAARHVIRSQFASSGDLQRRYAIGRDRADAVLAALEEHGIVGPSPAPGRSRTVLVVAGTVDQMHAVVDAAFPRPAVAGG
jgi:DNA segregation ATPase FtsK/SpoIIIE-like protein